MVLMILSHRYQAFPEKIFVTSKDEGLYPALQNSYELFVGVPLLSLDCGFLPLNLPYLMTMLGADDPWL